MEWYEILISAVATLGGVGGFVSIYKAKPEKTSIEVQNMKEMLNESHRMYDEMKAEKEEGQEEFKTFKETNNKYIAEFKERFAKLEKRLDAAEDAVFHLKGAIYQGYRCKFPTRIEDCPVIKEYEKSHCEDCKANVDFEK
jgi:predicted RNase H-like nuclease (RuvC/YqgF family)